MKPLGHFFYFSRWLSREGKVMHLINTGLGPYLTAICLPWEESERGWGVRPDGYSLHLTIVDVERYIKKYWDSMPNEVPDEYSRPGGAPYICLVDLETYEALKDSEAKNDYGIRRYDNKLPKEVKIP